MASGAVLRGPFSRYDYQRSPNSGLSSVKSYTTILPASATDVYYRDEIGNISTSHLRSEEDFTEVVIRPRFDNLLNPERICQSVLFACIDFVCAHRFPLFGGWQTRYYLGYNVPTYEYLFQSASHHVLSMRFVDHILDDQVIDEAVVKIVLPEGVKSVSAKFRHIFWVSGCCW